LRTLPLDGIDLVEIIDVGCRHGGAFPMRDESVRVLHRLTELIASTAY
jgi:hypothetical protein